MPSSRPVMIRMALAQVPASSPSFLYSRAQAVRLISGEPSSTMVSGAYHLRTCSMRWSRISSSASFGIL